MTDSTPTKDTERDGINPADQRTSIRKRYTRVANESPSCCGNDDTTRKKSQQLGYTDEELDAVAAGANLGLGCGNPTAIANLEPGDTVVDLGSGGGFDCFLAAQEVEPTGHVIGIDMTPKMVEKARSNVGSNNVSNVEFRLGEIEHLPLADASTDVVLSNCVVNLSPNKQSVFQEAYRVLRPGGRLTISDIVQTADLPTDTQTDPKTIAACTGGAAPISELESMLAEAGFKNVTIEPKTGSEEFIQTWNDERDLSEYLVAATIEAEKPK